MAGAELRIQAAEAAQLLTVGVQMTTIRLHKKRGSSGEKNGSSFSSEYMTDLDDVNVHHTTPRLVIMNYWEHPTIIVLQIVNVNSFKLIFLILNQPNSANLQFDLRYVMSK